MDSVTRVAAAVSQLLRWQDAGVKSLAFNPGTAVGRGLLTVRPKAFPGRATYFFNFYLFI